MSRRLLFACFTGVALFCGSNSASAQHRHRRHRHEAEQPQPAATTPTPPTPAQDPEEAEYLPSIAAANDGRPQEALGLFAAIYARNHAPRAVARMGTTEIQLGRWLYAEQHLREALAATQDAWINAHRANLETALARARQNLADLDVVCPVAGARLSIGGQPSISFPLAHPVRVVRGSVTIDVTAPDREPYRQVLNVTSATARTEVTLVARLPNRVVVQNVALREGATTAIVVAHPSQPTETTSGGPWRALGIASLVVGGAGVGLGVVGLVLRNGHADTFNNANCWASGGTVMGGGSCQDEYDSGSTMQSLSIAGFAAGGVFLVGGVALLAAAPSRRERATAWRCGGGPGDFGVACRVAF